MVYYNQKSVPLYSLYITATFSLSNKFTSLVKLGSSHVELVPRGILGSSKLETQGLHSAAIKRTWMTKQKKVTDTDSFKRDLLGFTIHDIRLQNTNMHITVLRPIERIGGSLKTVFQEEIKKQFRQNKLTLGFLYYFRVEVQIFAFFSCVCIIFG